MIELGKKGSAFARRLKKVQRINFSLAGKVNHITVLDEIWKVLHNENGRTVFDGIIQLRRRIDVTAITVWGVIVSGHRAHGFGYVARLSGAI